MRSAGALPFVLVALKFRPLCFGPRIDADIESGMLVRLDLPDWRGGEYAMQVVHKTETPPGPAGRWLIERLALPSPVR
jgi:hypothetical protein